MKKSIKKIIWSKRVMGSVVVAGAMVSAGVFGLSGYFGGGDAIPEDTMTRGLVAAYNFDEGSGDTLYNAADTGSANDGTLMNNPTWAEGNPSTGSGSSLRFDGTDDYVDCGNDSSLDITDAITIEAWVKPKEDSGWEGIVDKSYKDSIGSWSLYRNGQMVNFKIAITSDSTIGPSKASILNYNTWNYLVGTYSKTDEIIKLYHNGICVDSTSHTLPIQISIKNILIGDGNVDINNFNGAIDNVKIYNRALSAEEVRYHYNRGGPVGHWKLDEGTGSTAFDSTDNDNDGTLHLGSSGNTATSSAWVAGNPSTSSGSAMDFDGTDDYVSRAYDADFDFGTNSFTISSWFKHSVISSASDYLLSRYDSDQGFKLWMDDTGDMCFGIDDDATWGPDDSACTSGVDYDDNKWRHIVGYKDGTTGIYLYIDGILAASDTSLSATATLTSNSAPLHIGADAPTAGSYWDGLIDDVRIYDYARSPDEIRLDYNAGFAARFGGLAGRHSESSEESCSTDPASCMDHGLVASYDFDEGDGQTLYNAADTGSANDGTLMNNPTWAEGNPSTGSGSSLRFDGTDDYVDCGTDSSLDNAQTIEMWMKPGITYDSSLDANDYLFMKTNVSNEDRIGINFSVDSAPKGKISFWTEEHNNGNKALYSTTDTWTAGTWYHLVFTWDTTNGKRLYVNGVMENDDSGETTLPVEETVSLYSGGVPTLNFNGSIDNVKIYNRALSAEEIRYHYNRGGPVAHWRFDEGSGQYARDSIGDADAQLGSDVTSDGDTNDPTWSK